jgi:hypothetical protein
MPAGARRRALVTGVCRTILLAGAVVVLYFVLPFSNRGPLETTLVLWGGLAGVGCLFAWHLRAIARAPFPRLRAMEALVTAFPIFVVVFATTYYLMDQDVHGSFSQAMTRLDSLYFTMTTFATVGFGDIVPVSNQARVVTMVQMALDLALLGLVARAFFRSVQTGLARRDRPDDEGSPVS